MAGNVDAVCDVRRAMFAREYLSVVSRWARDQLRHEVQTAANRRRLRQLIEAAEALGTQMAPGEVTEENVIRLDDHRRGKQSDRAKRAARTLSFLDN
jgi:hypothetical protein